MRFARENTFIARVGVFGRVLIEFPRSLDSFEGGPCSSRFFVMPSAGVSLSTAALADEARTINSLVESGWREHAGERCPFLRAKIADHF